MTVLCHSQQKYLTGIRLGADHVAPQMRVETWRHGPGALPELNLTATEVAVLLAGRLRVRRTGDGQRQESMAMPGTFWLCPAGVHESDIALSGTMEETVHIFLPPDLLGDAALQEYDLDPASIRLDYAGGHCDPLLEQIARTFRSLGAGPASPVERLLSDSLRVTLATHLLRNYLLRSRPTVENARGRLDAVRLARVLDLVESGLDRDLSLDELAAAACLSPFHFARAFQRTTGKTPYAYLLERRIARAKDRLSHSSLSLVEIAQETGFATQSGFTRAFTKATGIPPGRFRIERR